MQPKSECSVYNSEVTTIDVRKYYKLKKIIHGNSAITIVDKIIMNFASNKKVVLNYSNVIIENPIDVGTSFKNIIGLLYNFYGLDYIKKNLLVQANPEITYLFNYIVTASSQ
ncbi:MAG: hypothetical protein EKK54_05555 [Neisseriaceae bacterium]|nr:MAG: hypothetical protein EKK54_05555 [Neisseriaceae bacterium]